MSFKWSYLYSFFISIDSARPSCSNNQSVLSIVSNHANLATSHKNLIAYWNIPYTPFIIKVLNKRMFSSSSSNSFKGNEPSKHPLKDFYEWFSGLTDGEDSFGIVKISPRKDYFSYSFRFQINLHIDDSQMLYNIRDLLGFGNVSENKNKNSSYFSVYSREDICKLITIF